MHKHMNAIQRACIFLLTLLLFLVPLSALGEPKAEPAPEAAAAETGITAFVSPTDTPSASAVFTDSTVMGDVQHAEENLSDQIDVPALNDARVAAQNALIETRTKNRPRPRQPSAPPKKPRAPRVRRPESAPRRSPARRQKKPRLKRTAASRARPQPPQTTARASRAPKKRAAGTAKASVSSSSPPTAPATSVPRDGGA